jgi:ATP-dependent protease ClpP protease subunit
MKSQIQIFNYSLFNQANDSLDVHIDGDIVDAPTQEIYKNWYGDETSVSFKSFRDAIEKDRQGLKTVNLFVNCLGGHVGDALAMHDYLNDLESNGIIVNRTGRGIIASAGTYLLMGKNSKMTKNSTMIIHNMQGGIGGSVNDIENYAKMMRTYNDLVTNMYVEQTGLKTTKVADMMNNETTLTAEEAKGFGFIKEIVESQNFTNAIQPERFPFKNKAILNHYNSFITPINNNFMDTTKITEAINNGFSALLEKLGISNKAGEDSVKNACTEFATYITNAIKESNKLDETAIKNLVDAGIADALKNLATKEEVKTGIADGLKNTLTVEDFTNKVDELKNAIVGKLGNSTKGNEGVGNKKRIGNKWSGANLWSEN